MTKLLKNIAYQCGKEDTIATNRSFLGRKVYPNPTKQFLQIELPETLSEQQLNIALYSMQGQQIQTWPASHTEKQRLDIKNIPAGIYWLNICSEEETILNRRVVVLP